jgi:hypothetical protein
MMEFMWVLARIKQDIVKWMETNPDKANAFLPPGPFFVYDHVRYHDAAEQLMVASGFNDRFPSPKWSPDFNRPVEHAHGVVKQVFKKRQEELPPGASMAAVKELIASIVNEHITADGVRKDVYGLPLLWRVVAASPEQEVEGDDGRKYTGTAGDWAPARLR